MILENKLKLTNQVELARAEEKISKQKAKQLFDSGDMHKVQAGTFAGLAFIHAYLFGEIYEFAGENPQRQYKQGRFSFCPCDVPRGRTQTH